MTPERLQNSVHLRSLLGRLHEASLLSRLVVDEAHCVVSWGRDFRPDYLELGTLRSDVLPGVPTMLLSATLPPLCADLFDSMRMHQEDVVVVEGNLDRPNLHYEVWL